MAHVRAVRALGDGGPGVTFLFGAVANEREVWDLFDRVGCIVVDDEIIKHGLAVRTSNGFGKHPSDLARVLSGIAIRSRRTKFGATIIDGARPTEEVVEGVRRLGEDS